LPRQRYKSDPITGANLAQRKRAKKYIQIIAANLAFSGRGRIISRGLPEE
jgi:hypothetical protein